MSKYIQAVRGMHDIAPQQTPLWQQFEAAARALMHSYAYQEIRLPIVEKTELFVRTIGEVTDIVEKEMYTFEDRNGDSLTLRPEGTAGCVRAGIENGLLHNQIQRLWYLGPMFRHERPQQGRYRQFHQMGVETFGMAGPDVDVELILMTARLWRLLGVGDMRLQINSLGSHAARQRYRRILVEYFTDREQELDDDSRRRLHRNPMRILDSKNPDMETLIADAPRMTDYLDEESAEHFACLCTWLDATGIEYEPNPRLMRGLDYYEKTVFEWITDKLGAQGTVCAGGRYDGLVAQLGGRSTPAAGFAMGIERLLALMMHAGQPESAAAPDVYLVIAGDDIVPHGLALAEQLRDAMPALSLRVNCGGGGFGNQLKRADKSAAAVALILGDDEIAGDRVACKFLREERPQQSVARDRLVEFLKNEL